MIAVGIAMMLIAGVAVMMDTDFGRRVPCEVTHVGYDSYVDGEWVERVDEVVYVGDCEGVRGGEVGEYPKERDEHLFAD